MISDDKTRWYFLIVFIKLDNVKLIQKLNQVCFLISPIVNLLVGSTFKMFLIKSLASPWIYLGNLKSPTIIFLYN